MTGRWASRLFWVTHIGGLLLAAPLAVGGLLAAGLLVVVVVSLGGTP